LLNIFKSNKTENLMQALVSVLKHVPDDTMIPEWIGIQSRGMKQWIAAQIADNLGVCANMHFLFPRQVIDQVLDAFNTPEDKKGDQKENQTNDSVQDKKESLNEDILFWSIMKLLDKSQSVKELS
jgi:exodeoxyribonuclease V gamma subunit